MKQFIFPERRIFNRGDLLTFRLECPNAEVGDAAFVRTNLGMAGVRRREIINHVEHELPILGSDWHDIPMKRLSPGIYQLVLALLEVGVFEAKCFLMNHISEREAWPQGGNFRLKIEPSENISGNTIYTAFVRQFIRKPHPAADSIANLTELEKAGYTIIPPSGTFRGLIEKLDFIFGTLRSRILQLLPIHPAPATYARMGRYGSPFAALDYFDVDPALAEFDPTASPMEQFDELIEQVHARNGRIFMDIPVNHTGWASKLQEAHPEWFVRDAAGKFISPGAWGVTWGDLCKLDYTQEEVCNFMAEVFLFWCRRGVDGFRCDAGYMLPVAAWDYINAKVREEFPDTVFMLEGLGGPWDKQSQLLEQSGLNWAYSELFQNYSRSQIESYFPVMYNVSRNSGLLVNFAETHDNNRLAAVSVKFAQMRTALCALLSLNGAFGFANGVEWFANEKIDVHSCNDLNWGSKNNQVDFIRRLQILLEAHPAFGNSGEIQLITRSGVECLAVLRQSRQFDGGAISPLLILVNLDCQQSQSVEFDGRGINWSNAADLLTGEPFEILEQPNKLCKLLLSPGQTLVLISTADPLYGEIRDKINYPLHICPGENRQIILQRARAMMFRAITLLKNDLDLSDLDNPDADCMKFLNSPLQYCRNIIASPISRVMVIDPVRDCRRNVMLPQRGLLLVRHHAKFRMVLKYGDMTLRSGMSVPRAHEHFTLLCIPHNRIKRNVKLTMYLSAYTPSGKTSNFTVHMQLLPDCEDNEIRTIFQRERVIDENIYAFGSNERGSYTMFPAAFGSLRSKYDALLSANGQTPYPTERTTMLTRCRMWLVCYGYSQQLDVEKLLNYTGSVDNRGSWLFRVPVGQGKSVTLKMQFKFSETSDAVTLLFHRYACRSEDELPDRVPVKLIIRPDVESRINHQLTKAFTGPEKLFPASVIAGRDTFEFSPYDHKLIVSLADGEFHPEPQWNYMVELPLEKYYGLECNTDLFSPGYFQYKLKGDQICLLRCVVDEDLAQAPTLEDFKDPLPDRLQLSDALPRALRRYVVRRDDHKSIIAGYPWFLDWGRDTLIALRGIIAAGMQNEAQDILLQFAKYEENGTLPNMIRGNDVSNRDTSDAPLCFFVAAGDYMEQNGDEILQADCGNGRTLLEVMNSIFTNYVKGTPNGIRMDESSKLVYSPAHFTWMDTNYPAASPRAGYPVEIQALWYNAVRVLKDYNSHAAQILPEIRHSIIQYFYHPESSSFSDCLLANEFTAAADALPDDAVRPNQLFLLTLGVLDEKLHCGSILQSATDLIVPGAIRSLSDRRLDVPLPVNWLGQLLNDPYHPYRGIYSGPEDTSRKVAYHNGTCWMWPFPSYCEAIYIIGGESARSLALSILLSAKYYLECGAVGQLPEVADGDYPHTSGGCPAQAWSMTEFYRVYRKLQKSPSTDETMEKTNF